MIELPPNSEIFYTQDGSPTLSLKREDGYVEKMHHSGGALSESLYIYRAALNEALERGWPIRIFSLGLGLAYNEIISISELRKREVGEFKIFSFESVTQLREGFKAWAGGASGGKLAFVLDQVLKQVAQAQEVPAPLLRSWIKAAIADGALEVREGFPADSGEVDQISVCFYDAFSKKMNPELWAEDMLKSTLDRLLSRNCVLTTYAATGTLNRSLKHLGFSLLDKAGFSGKRESTLAIRELAR